jgi:hypothetical protein
MKLKKKEFADLKHGSISMNEYLNSFIHLSRYATDDINTDEKKQDMCWCSTAGGYRSPTGEGNDTENNANSCQSITSPPRSAPSGLFIGEVKGLITMP